MSRKTRSRFTRHCPWPSVEDRACLVAEIDAAAASIAECYASLPQPAQARLTALATTLATLRRAAITIERTIPHDQPVPAIHRPAARRRVQGASQANATPQAQA